MASVAGSTARPDDSAMNHIMIDGAPRDTEIRKSVIAEPS
jgi:hypothetical protein